MEVVEAATPAEVAQRLRTSESWVREQARRNRVPHLRLARRKIAFLPEHEAALRKLATVEAAAPKPLPRATIAALGASTRSRRAHRRTA